MADEQKQAVIRMFRIFALMQREAGVQIDGRDPAFRELCDDPRLAEMTEEELKARAGEMFKTASDYVC